MDHDQSIRDNLARYLRDSMRQQGMTYTGLIEATGLHPDLVDLATTHGCADTVDLIRITRALDLSVTDLIAESVNHVGGTPGSRISASAAAESADQITITGEELLSHEDDHAAIQKAAEKYPS